MSLAPVRLYNTYDRVKVVLQPAREGVVRL
jgi:hypothetical protein